MSNREMTSDWFLLYGGSSADGAGPGVYVGRTMERVRALAHFDEIRRDPYSTGRVVVVTDTQMQTVMNRKELSR